MGEQGGQEGTKHAPVNDPFVEGQHSGCVIAYPHHLGVAPQEVQNPVAEVFSPMVLSLVMSLEGTVVLNAEL